MDNLSSIKIHNNIYIYNTLITLDRYSNLYII